MAKKKSRAKRRRKGQSTARTPRTAPHRKPATTRKVAETEKPAQTGGAPPVYSLRAMQTATRRKVGPQQQRSQVTAQDYAAQYEHVAQDLRRIALLAGSFLAVMIALTFVLH